MRSTPGALAALVKQFWDDDWQVVRTSLEHILVLSI